jgi:hypothetical protein
MFVGHLAVALGARQAAPRAPLGALIGAAFALDLVWPFFLFTGIEVVRIDPGNTAFTPLAFDYYPWSHSLSMAVVWAVAIGRIAAAALKQARAGLVIGITVLSHWLLDFVTHRPDLPLWPGGPQVGAGLWNSIPLTLVVEGALFAGGVALYLRATRPRDALGTWSFWGLVLLTTAVWVSGPVSPPPPSETAIAVVALAMWLFPLWGWWIERHRITTAAGQGARRVRPT